MARSSPMRMAAAATSTRHGRRRHARGGLGLADRHRRRERGRTARSKNPAAPSADERDVGGRLAATSSRAADTSGRAIGVPGADRREQRGEGVPGVAGGGHVAEAGHEVQADAAEAVLEVALERARASRRGRRRRWCPGSSGGRRRRRAWRSRAARCPSARARRPAASRPAAPRRCGRCRGARGCRRGPATSPTSTTAGSMAPTAWRTVERIVSVDLLACTSRARSPSRR